MKAFLKKRNNSAIVNILAASHHRLLVLLQPRFGTVSLPQCTIAIKRCTNLALFDLSCPSAIKLHKQLLRFQNVP